MHLFYVWVHEYWSMFKFYRAWQPLYKSQAPDVVCHLRRDVANILVDGIAGRGLAGRTDLNVE